jgi:hypothetical protein
MKAQSITFQTKNAKNLNILKAIGEALHLQFAISTTTEASYDKDFVKKIEEGINDKNNGNFTSISSEDLKNLWK